MTDTTSPWHLSLTPRIVSSRERALEPAKFHGARLRKELLPSDAKLVLTGFGTFPGAGVEAYLHKFIPGLEPCRTKKTQRTEQRMLLRTAVVADEMPVKCHVFHCYSALLTRIRDRNRGREIKIREIKIRDKR